MSAPDPPLSSADKSYVPTATALPFREYVIQKRNCDLYVARSNGFLVHASYALVFPSQESAENYRQRHLKPADAFRVCRRNRDGHVSPL